MNQRRFIYCLLTALILCCSAGLYAQNRTVSGKVTDLSTGKPLSGATISVKGENQSIATDAQGNFSISVPANGSLVVSYIGFGTQEIAINSQSTVNVTMSNTASSLNDVVVIGFGQTRKRDLTGSVVSVKPEEITARPGPNPMESLQGRVPGLDITRPSGQAGAPVYLQLRGNRSFTASGNPLFIINGLPGDYATLNPYDIESIEVLKDASSTAVYGSAGSNGVIIITTKSGRAGKTNVDFNTYYGYNGWAITPTMRKGDSYLQAKRDAYKYVWDATAMKWTTTGALWQSPADDEKIFGNVRYPLFQAGEYVDWADLLLNDNSATQNYSLSVSGGTDKTKAYLSANYMDERGQYTGDRYKQYSTTMRVDHRVRNWLNIGTNLQASYVDRSRAADKLENILTTDPLIKAYNADGTLNTNLGNNVYNLLLDYQPGVYGNVDNNTKIHLNPYVEIKPIKGLSILSRAGVRMDYSNGYRFDGIGSVAYTYNNANIAKARVVQNRFQNYQWENIVTYNRMFAGKHDVTVTGATSYYHNQNTTTEMNQSNITSNNFKWYRFSGDVNTTALSNYNMSKTLAFIGRVNYSYLGRYLFSASIRRDASTVLDKNHMWDNFPAVSAGWRFSDERFMDFARNWLTNGKIRIGWGVTGSAKIDPYSSVSSLEATNMALGGTTVPMYRNSPYLTNPELGWEKSYNTNYGLDLTLFRNRVDLALDYYTTRTDGVIYNVTSPIIYGTYRPGTNYQTYFNIAQTMNKGFEVALNTRNIVTKDFEWTSNIAFSTNKEEILKLTTGTANNIPNTVTAGDRINGNFALAIGYPVNSFRNFKLDGVWQIGEEADAAVFNKIPGDLKVNVPGMEKLATGVYRKTNTDGTQAYYYTNLADAQKFNPALTAANAKYTYSNNDFQILGSNTPDWSLGFQNRFRYKNWELTVYSYVRWGQMISYNMMGWYQPNAFATNASPSRTFPEYFNYWTPENPTNDFPVMNYQYSSSTFTGFSGLNFIDGSFWKIKNITLAYSLPASTFKKVAFQRIRVYATITNPLIVAKSPLIKDYDPEMNGSLEYPLTKQAVIGLNLSF